MPKKVTMNVLTELKPKGMYNKNIYPCSASSCTDIVKLDFFQHVSNLISDFKTQPVLALFIFNPRMDESCIL